MNDENERLDVQEKSEWSPVRWAFDIWTWLLLVVAVLAFEVFADPLLAGLVVSLKLAWSDAWAGHRIAKDPSYWRGTMLSSFYSGRACLKVAFAGAVGAIGITAAELALGMNFKVERLLVGLVLTYSGFFFGALFILGGAVVMNRGYWRPWVDKLHYPQIPPRHFGPKNLVRRILVGGMVAASVTMLPFVMAFGAARGPIPFVPLGLATGLLLVWAWSVWQMIFALRNVAATPEQCWPELADK